ncbi:unnamed protein product [Protopolystoma xenopodis]|uniref:Uncharacterized protein n=1 Tax=Protopolystoma xenopodis TaxID=117903 RepID=A0A3S5AN62_9PLAT|nr:unnamed protein product [Protopolystoma xenopodis]
MSSFHILARKETAMSSLFPTLCSCATENTTVTALVAMSLSRIIQRATHLVFWYEKRLIMPVSGRCMATSRRLAARFCHENTPTARRARIRPTAAKSAKSFESA